MNYAINMTAKERQLWYWQNEVDSRFKAWKEAVDRGDKDEADRRKADYVSARITYDQLGGGKNA